MEETNIDSENIKCIQYIEPAIFSRGKYIFGHNVLGQPMTIKIIILLIGLFHILIYVLCIISLISILKQGKEDFGKEKPINDI